MEYHAMLTQYQTIVMDTLIMVLQDPNMIALGAMLQTQVGGTLLTYGAVGISSYVLGKATTSRKRVREETVEQHKPVVAQQELQTYNHSSDDKDEEVVEATELQTYNHASEDEDEEVVASTELQTYNHASDDEDESTLEELKELRNKLESLEQRLQKRARIM